MCLYIGYFMIFQYVSYVYLKYYNLKMLILNEEIQIILLTRFDSKFHFNTEVNNTRLILPIANLLCCAWVGKRIQ